MLGDLMVRFASLLVDQGLRLRAQTAMGTPPAGHSHYYVKTADGLLYQKQGSGVEIQIPVIASTTYVPTWGGFSVAPTNGVAKYSRIGKLVWVKVNGWAAGTSNATTMTITLPFNSLAADVMAGMGKAFDNGAGLDAPMRIDTRAGSNVADLYRGLTTLGWTGSAGKVADFTLLYEAE